MWEIVESLFHPLVCLLLTLATPYSKIESQTGMPLRTDATVKVF
jgi:hypothetical protein